MLGKVCKTFFIRLPPITSVYHPEVLWGPVKYGFHFFACLCIILKCIIRTKTVKQLAWIFLCVSYGKCIFYRGKTCSYHRYHRLVTVRIGATFHYRWTQVVFHHFHQTLIFVTGRFVRELRRKITRSEEDLRRTWWKLMRWKVENCDGWEAQREFVVARTLICARIMICEEIKF